MCFDTGNVSEKLVFTSVHPLSFFWIVTVAYLLSFAGNFVHVRNSTEMTKYGFSSPEFNTTVGMICSSPKFPPNIR